MRAGLWAALVVVACGCGTPVRQPLPLGAQCDPSAPAGSLPCADGLCVGLDSKSGFCTRTCENNTNCPESYLCQAAGRFGRICRQLEGC